MLRELACFQCDKPFTRNVCESRFEKIQHHFCSRNCADSHKRKDMVGERFGKLRVIKISNKKYSWGTYYDCICDCGRESTIRGLTLRRKKMASCRFCRNSQRIGQLTKSFFNGYKKSARHRDIGFDITQEYLWELFLEQNSKCYYTGMEIKLPYTKNDFRYGNYTASLDRKNPDLSYQTGNVVWCHKTINFFKSTDNFNQFVLRCKLINDFDQNFPLFDNKIEINEDKRYRGFNSISSTLLYFYKTHNPELEFDITCKDIWDQYVKQGGVCYLTGIPVRFEPSIRKLQRNCDLQTGSLYMMNRKLEYINGNFVIIHKKIGVGRWEFTIDQIKEIAKQVTNIHGD